MPILPSLYRDLIALSAPIAGIQFAQIALTSTDLIMMGMIGMEAVAAGGLAALLYNQFRTMCVGMVTGLGNLVAESIGRAERRSDDLRMDTTAQAEIQDLIRSALFLATAVAVLGGGLLAGLGFCLQWLGQDPDLVLLARPVMMALAPGLLPMVWLNVLRQFAVGMRRPGSLFWVTLLSIAVNATLNAIFIYGWLGIPKLGLVGIGLSTSAVQLWSFAVYLRSLRRDPALRTYLSLALWKAKPSTVAKIAKMGIPISLTYGLEASITSFASIMLGHYGPVVLAASNIINQLMKIVYQLNVALSHGSSVMVSRAVGRQHYEEVKNIAHATLLLCFIPMVSLGAIFLLFPNWAMRPFLGSESEPLLLTTASALLWFGVITQLFSAWQNISIGLLRGLGNTKAGLYNTFFGYFVVGIPVILCSSYWINLHEKGVWLGLCIAFGTTAVLLWKQFWLDFDKATPPKAENKLRELSPV